MTITAGELRARLQPNILLRITSAVPTLEGDEVFGPGVVVYTQYLGNGNVQLTPVISRDGGSRVAKVSAVNSRASIITERELAETLSPSTESAAQAQVRKLVQYG